MVNGLARRLVRQVFERIGVSKRYRLRVELSDGTAISNHDGGADSDITVTFRTPGAERRMLFELFHGFLEAYIEGAIDISGEMPLTRLAEMAHDVYGDASKPSLAMSPITYLERLWHEHRHNNRDPAVAKRNADFHYAIDPRFFEFKLGDTVGYSEGYWVDGTTTLDQAKYNNYEYICRKLLLKPGDRVLEVGSGWGYMPMLMADKYGAEVTVFNPVARQNAYMAERLAKRGLGDRITLVEADHRDIAREAGRFDKFVSIGVHEHAGKDCYFSWMESIAAALRPGGIGVVSTTTLMPYELTNFIITKHIFPGGHIPSLPRILRSLNQYGLTLVDIECLWPHYQRTLVEWRRNLDRHWEKIHALDPAFFDERFKRRWTIYLEGTIETFGYSLDLMHIVFVKGRDADLYDATRRDCHRQAEFATGAQTVETYR